MCGVIGYIGQGIPTHSLYLGLKQLEYRGYDSSGIAVLENSEYFIQKSEGKLFELEKKLNLIPDMCHLGIGHTRWATHGKPSEENAHPHRSGPIVLLHNGIIENYRDLKSDLSQLGYTFNSETDTEVAVHLIHHEYKLLDLPHGEEKMKLALMNSVKKIKGAYSFGIINSHTPDTLYALKSGSPLVIGLGTTGHFFASGITALLDQTKNILIMEDEDLAILKTNSIQIFNFEGQLVSRQPIHLDWSSHMIEKAGFRHFMLKEIHENPFAIQKTMEGRIDKITQKILFPELKTLDMKNIQKIQLIACGTSYYASLVGKFFMESLTGLTVEVDLASEYRYRSCTANPHTLSIAISQSGETADTLQALKYAKSFGAQTLSVVNVPGSSIGHIAQFEVLTHAGPEIGVASTKAFSAQLTLLSLFALYFQQSLIENKITLPKHLVSGKDFIDSLPLLPSLVDRVLSLSSSIQTIANNYHHDSQMIFIGRGPLWPIALEGALKLKEISYIHAEGYAGGELKHGPIALIDSDLTVVALMPKDPVYYDKIISNIEEIKARGGKILGIGSENDAHAMDLSDHYIPLPDCSPWLHPFLSTVPLQLFAYWVAVAKGTDVDQPRNLAKSVTVE